MIFSHRRKDRYLFFDNGTNFVGANRELQMLINMLKKDVEILNNDLSQDGIHGISFLVDQLISEDFRNPVLNQSNIISKGLLEKSC